MTYIVTDACVRCKFMDCVEVCPVDCFYEGENFLVINPDECIDCGVCEPECPVDAIKPDTEDEPDGKWLQINASYAKVWPNITIKGTPPALLKGRLNGGVRQRSSVSSQVMRSMSARRSAMESGVIACRCPRRGEVRFQARGSE